MLKFHADSFYRITGWLARIRSIVEDLEKHHSLDLNCQVFSAEDDHNLRQWLLQDGIELRKHLTVLNAKVTRIALDDLMARIQDKKCTFAELGNSAHDIDRRIEDELSLTSLFALDESTAKYFEPDQPLFGADVQTKFPSASYEVDEAGKCLALSRPTACVFHLMRTLEIGIRATSRCLNIPDPIKPADRNWGAMLRKFKEEFDARNRAPVRWTGNDRGFFEEVYASLDAVRNVWRNATMHVENKGAYIRVPLT